MPNITKYKKYLIKKGISQQKVMKGSGVNQTSLNKLANGYANCTMKTLAAICKYHNISPNAVLDYEPWLKKRPNKTSK